MKITSFLKLSLITGGLVLATNSCLKAQDSSSGGGGHHDSGLTSEERSEIKADRDKVLAADPDLKKEDDDLKSQRSSMSSASDDDKAAFKAKWHTHMDKVNDAIEKIDPNAAPLIAKMQAARKAREAGGSQ